MSLQWESTYQSKADSERSWTQKVPRESLQLIDQLALKLDDPIIDIGAGSSALVDSLISRLHTDITVLDISSTAIAESRARIETTYGKNTAVHWIIADIAIFSPDRSYALWHDRAVFHFLIDRSDQQRYVQCATRAVRPGGSLIIATFSPEGPEMCSGFPVHRWSAGELGGLFAPDFGVIESFERDHQTPWGSMQPFTWVLMRRN
ncbi:MAG TPA: class I SAM-dependent methyltransferase [Acidimicrobiales bacterium]|nr:class I SAM-dependent methyltransferase [Acidimicrobiales bacterium]